SLDRGGLVELDSSSARCSTAGIKLNQTTTIKAIAIATGYANSIVATGTYTLHLPQTITFPQPASPVIYGVKPITLSATSTSVLPVTFKLLSGAATLSGSTLTIKGVGPGVALAHQAGNTGYSAAIQVTRTIAVNKASLVATAVNASMTYG